MQICTPLVVLKCHKHVRLFLVSHILVHSLKKGFSHVIHVYVLFFVVYSHIYVIKEWLFCSNYKYGEYGKSGSHAEFIGHRRCWHVWGSTLFFFFVLLTLCFPKLVLHWGLSLYVFLLLLTLQFFDRIE